MIIRLQHQRSDGDLDTYHLKSGRRYHIGRGSACEVRILDLKLSRKHCAVEYTEGEWRVIDLASTNGCKVDGDQIVGSVPLKVGTKIEIGQSAITVSRILGDDEDEDDDTVSAAAAAAAPQPARKTGAPPQQLNLRTPPGGTEDTVRSLPEQLKLDTPKPADRSGPVEHLESDWEPEPEPEAVKKTGALVPHPAADAAADKALDAARRAALDAAAPGSDGTGEIQKPHRTPVSELGKNPANARTPVPRQPTPLPMAVPELESGPYKSLDPQPGKPAPPAKGPVQPVLVQAGTDEPAAPKHELELELDLGAPAPAPARPASLPAPPPKPPGTETRKRQKVMPVLVQPMSADELDTLPKAETPAPAAPSAPPRPAPAPKAPSATIPAPAAEPAPAPAAAAKPGAAGGDDRTFYITVLGRRVGPLTRAAARDLKARELKGTLTLKDLDQFS